MVKVMVSGRWLVPLPLHRSHTVLARHRQLPRTRAGSGAGGRVHPNLASRAKHQLWSQLSLNEASLGGLRRLSGPTVEDLFNLCHFKSVREMQSRLKPPESLKTNFPSIVGTCAVYHLRTSSSSSDFVSPSQI